VKPIPSYGELHSAGARDVLARLQRIVTVKELHYSLPRIRFISEGCDDSGELIIGGASEHPGPVGSENGSLVVGRFSVVRDVVLYEIESIAARENPKQLTKAAEKDAARLCSTEPNTWGREL
jgi:hypothetical protein